MGKWWKFWGASPTSRSSTSAAGVPPVTPKFTNFKRANLAHFDPRLTTRLESWISGRDDFKIDPRLVSLESLRGMGTYPSVYLAERTISGIMRRPDLYSIEHADPKIKAETEEWLWPLLDKILNPAAHAFAYGVNVIIFEWERSLLKTRVLSPTTGQIRNKNIKKHNHYKDAHEVWPLDVDFEFDDAGRVKTVTHNKTTYGPGQFHIFTWDGEFGDIRGQSARRRAWRDYCEVLILKILETRYLERSVDSPRIGFAPDGAQEFDGVETQNADMLKDLLMSLRGSGVAVFPSERDGDGNLHYDVKTLDIPDVHEVWTAAISRRNANIFISYLASPSLAGLEDMGAAAGKTVEGMLREFVDDLVIWSSSNLQSIVDIVHCANYDPDVVTPPEVTTTDVGKREARKSLMVALQLANAAPEGELAKVLDVPRAVDQMGFPVRVVEEPPSGQGGSLTGRPRAPLGDREERREDARTVEGEEAVGAPGEGE